MNTDTTETPAATEATGGKQPVQPRKRRMAREPNADNEPIGKPAPPAREMAATRERGPSKIAAVIALLEREQGATLAELMKATDWLAHTTRAALTGLKKRGHALTKDKRDGVTCYRVAKDSE